MPKISIIVPVYRVEEYLDKCVQSILNQTFTDFELILVDDGSPDRCGEMCDGYAEKDSRVKVIHKENGGLSDARNAGIDAASAEYIGFVDSDDYIAEDMYEMLYENIVKYDADISACGLFNCYETRKIRQYDKDELLIVNQSEGIGIILEGKKLSVNAVNKLFVKTLFHNIRFPVGKLSEDAYVMIKLFGQAQKMVIETKPKYYYIHRAESITTSNYTQRDYNVVEAYKNNLLYVQDHFPEHIAKAKFRYLWAYIYVYEKMIVSQTMVNDNEYNELTKWLKKHAIKYLTNPYFSYKRKLMMLILCCSPALYRLMILKREMMVLKTFNKTN